MAEQEIEQATDLAVTLGWVVLAITLAFVVVTLASKLVRFAARRHDTVREIALRMRWPAHATFMVLGMWIAVWSTANRDDPWLPVLEHVVLVSVILSSAWMVATIALVIEDRALHRVGNRLSGRHARRLRTQIMVVRRLTIGLVSVVACAAVLFTFPEARTASASLLASAGVLSVIAALAAQSSLGNVFAGLQIVFSDAVRVGDVVVVEGEWGRIEDITLAYVVVGIWDERKLILPCTYFTSTPYENWTRQSSEVLGTVEIDVDFRVPLDDMRAELRRIVTESPLWDGRVVSLQVTSAVSGVVRARALVSGADSSALWDLRCEVREGLVSWLQREAPDALPRSRWESGAAGAVAEGAAQIRV
ncbi:mechanosensitive ion channel family protein [Promicromonospora panici]|uniref:mechanosensitive ion channel family protein n=1 Tax=Promicromonospora panici TaxID=2219658 RepID=UPI00101C5F39|nr:mechanosensitive ion channel domain-containing protein [Promicromonospora panici]